MRRRTAELTVTALGRTLAPSTTAKHLGLLSMTMQTAIRARLIGVKGVRVPRDRAREAGPGTVSREAFFGRLLPAVPVEHGASSTLPPGGAALG